MLSFFVISFHSCQQIRSSAFHWEDSGLVRPNYTEREMKAVFPHHGALLAKISILNATVVVCSLAQQPHSRFTATLTL